MPSKDGMNEMKDMVKRAVEKELEGKGAGFPLFHNSETNLMVNLTFYVDCPKAHFNAQGTIKPRFKQGGAFACGCYGNLDNLVKFILNAMQDLLYKNDTQVGVLTATKAFTERNSTSMHKKGGSTSIQVTRVKAKALI